MTYRFGFLLYQYKEVINIIKMVHHFIKNVYKCLIYVKTSGVNAESNREKRKQATDFFFSDMFFKF